MNGKSFWPGVDGKSPVNPALNLVSLVLAAASAMVCTPLIYHPSIAYVEGWIELQYGVGYIGLGSFVYGTMLSAVVFGIARIFWLFAIMALVAGTIALSYRFIPAMAI